MEKLASRHAIAELMSWISLMENIIQEDQDKILEAVGSEVVQTYIQKYKVPERDVSKTPHTWAFWGWKLKPIWLINASNVALVDK